MVHGDQGPDSRVEAACSGRRRTQAELVLAQSGEQWCHQVEQLGDAEAESCVAERALSMHLHHGERASALSQRDNG